MAKQRMRKSLHRGQRAVAARGLHLFAAALGDIFPVMRIVVDGRGAGAGRAGAGGAIVLAGERDAEALVGARLRRSRTRLGGGSEGAGERGGKRGGGDGGSDVHKRNPPS